MNGRTSLGQLDHLQQRLTARGIDIISNLERCRLMSTRQLQRLHFPVSREHVTGAAATRACTRVLGRLRSHRLIDHLDRRIGGVRSGSAGFVWQLANLGERLLRRIRGGSVRHRYIEPSQRYCAHTVAVAEVAVRLHEAAHYGAFELRELVTEPANWRQFLGTHGATETLKPDLHAITTDGTYEDHWFLEVDLATEHAPTIGRKCHLYGRYAQTGGYQAEWGLFLAVVWIAPDKARARIIEAAIDGNPQLQTELFRVVQADQFPAGWRPAP